MEPHHRRRASAAAPAPTSGSITTWVTFKGRQVEPRWAARSLPRSGRRRSTVWLPDGRAAHVQSLMTGVRGGRVRWQGGWHRRERHPPDSRSLEYVPGSERLEFFFFFFYFRPVQRGHMARRPARRRSGRAAAVWRFPADEGGRSTDVHRSCKRPGHGGPQQGCSPHSTSPRGDRVRVWWCRTMRWYSLPFFVGLPSLRGRGRPALHDAQRAGALGRIVTDSGADRGRRVGHVTQPIAEGQSSTLRHRGASTSSRAVKRASFRRAVPRASVV